jgi:GT2 family glycosyltransferase
VSVIIRTIGRPELLRDALQSLAESEPPPAEILVVDQSTELVSAPVVEEVGPPGTQLVALQPPGRARAFNAGLERASHNTVLVVDDDCTVRQDWISAACRAMQQDPVGMISGRVLPPPGVDQRRVPSTIALETPRDYTGNSHRPALYANNMACPRDAVLAIGGFDERIAPFAEDSEFCFRWLRAGRSFRHVPEMVVWHQAWRTPEQLERLHVEYYQGMGVFYAKYLAAGDLSVLRMLLGDCYQALRSLYSARFRGVERWADERRGTFPGLTQGLRAGWREFRSQRRP